MFIGSQSGKVYSLDAKSGCTYWEFDAGRPVRTAVVVGPRGAAGRPISATSGGKVHAVDALTGKELWTTQDRRSPRRDHHRRADARRRRPCSCRFLRSRKSPAPTRLFLLHFPRQRRRVGGVDRQSSLEGYTIPQPAKPAASQFGRRAIDGTFGRGDLVGADVRRARTDRVYVTTGDNYSDPPTNDLRRHPRLRRRLRRIGVVAPDDVGGRLSTSPAIGGARANCPQANGPDFDFGSSAVLVDLAGGKRVLIAAQKSGVVTALDPDRAREIVWQKRVGNGGSIRRRAMGRGGGSEQCLRRRVRR